MLRFPSRTTKIEFRGENGTNGNSTYSDGVTVDASRAFTNNILKVELPKTIVEIGRSSFGGIGNTQRSFTALKEINLPNSITSIGDRAFAYCSCISEIIIPNSVTSIGDGVFEGCSGIGEIIIPNSITSIGDSAFAVCSGISEIIIPDSVKTIHQNAFSDCNDLTRIFIPKEVLTIFGPRIVPGPKYLYYEGIFDGCSNDLQIYTDATEEQPGWGECWNHNGDERLTVHYGVSLEQFNTL